jgi:NADH-quinone oxidoreductase subunit C
MMAAPGTMTGDRARELLATVAGVTVAPAGTGTPLTGHVLPQRWLEVARLAKETLGCAFFNFLTAVDWKDDGLEVVAWVDNLDAALAVQLRTKLGPGQTACPSLVPLYRGAEWMERECFDMFGVQFAGHPDPRRILLADDWQGHPLLKSYAVDTPHPPYR